MEFAGMEDLRCDRQGSVCMWQTLFDLELGLALAEIFGLGEKRHVVERIRANRYMRNPDFLRLCQA